jgi:hypothetical protein
LQKKRQKISLIATKFRNKFHKSKDLIKAIDEDSEKRTQAEIDQSQTPDSAPATGPQLGAAGPSHVPRRQHSL